MPRAGNVAHYVGPGYRYNRVGDVAEGQVLGVRFVRVGVAVIVSAWGFDLNVIAGRFSITRTPKA